MRGDDAADPGGSVGAGLPGVLVYVGGVAAVNRHDAVRVAPSAEARLAVTDEMSEAAMAVDFLPEATVNRALQLYWLLSEMDAEGWEVLLHRDLERPKLWGLFPRKGCETKRIEFK